MAAPENQCERMQDLLSLFVDGRLSPADVARVEAHVARCADCASYLGFLRATNFAITHRPVVTPSASLYARIAQMTPERIAPPTVTWSQRLSRLLAPAPTRWALGTALAAAGIVGVAVLPHGVNNPGTGYHSPVAVASHKPTSTIKAKSQVATIRPVAKRSTAPAVKPASPAVTTNAARQVAVVAPHSAAQPTVIAPRRSRPSEAGAPTLAVSMPTPVRRILPPVVPSANPASHPSIAAPRLAVNATTPKTAPISVSRNPVADAVRTAIHEREHLTLAAREMELNQRKAAMAALAAHESNSESVTHSESPVESTAINPSTTVAVAPVKVPVTPVSVTPVKVAVVSSPRRFTLAAAGYDDQKPVKYTLPGIAADHRAPMKADGFVPVVSDN